MKFFRRPKSLFFKTSITLAISLTLFIALVISIALYFVFFPMANRAADDMAALISEVGRTWVSMSEEDRSEFQAHLREMHLLFITSDPVAVTEIKEFYPIIPRLEKSFHLHTGQHVIIKQDVEKRHCFWVEILFDGQPVSVGFLHDRFGPRPSIALVSMFAAGCFLILITTIFLVRRITRPIKTLSDAASQYGSGNFAIRIPENGPAELVSLAHSFNLMAQELSQLLANRAILFGGISHDLRTPLTRIHIALELLEDNKNKALFAGMQRDLEEMNQLIQQAVALVKGLDKHKVVAVDMDEFISGIVSDYRRQKLSIRWQASGCGVCKVEANALHRVLSNLLDNAFRYGEKAPVEMLCLHKNNKLIIRIIDNGSGIPQENLETVFQPFFRLDNSRSKKTGGSGMGLAIVRQLCETYAWEIRLIPGKEKGLEARLEIQCF